MRTSAGHSLFSLTACSLLLALASAANPVSAAAGLERIRDIPLPGNPTRWDYMAFDPVRQQLVIAHLGDSQVVVVNPREGKVIGTVGDIRDVHGVLAVPESKRFYATATGSNELVAIDAQTLQVLGRAPTGRYPDGLAYAPFAQKIYVSDAHGKSETVIDARTHQRIATIPLGGSVGNTQYDSETQHIFVNVQGRRELVEIEPKTDRIVKRIRLPGAEGNHGLLIDAKRRLAFIACEGNDRLLVLNLETSSVASTFPVAGEPDVLAYDGQQGLLYVATERGTVYLFKVDDDGVRPAGEAAIGMNAHTIAVDPDRHEAYLPLNLPDGKAVLRVMRPVR